MRYRLHLNFMLVLLIGLGGCASSRLRSFPWLRSHAVQSQVAQSAANETATTIESLSAAPPKLPPGIELPPESPTSPQTLPSGATQPADNTNAGVIFASVEGAQQ